MKNGGDEGACTSNQQKCILRQTEPHRVAGHPFGAIRAEWPAEECAPCLAAGVEHAVCESSWGTGGAAALADAWAGRGAEAHAAGAEGHAEQVFRAGDAQAERAGRCEICWGEAEGEVVWTRKAGLTGEAVPVAVAARSADATVLARVDRAGSAFRAEPAPARRAGVAQRGCVDAAAAYADLIIRAAVATRGSTGPCDTDNARILAGPGVVARCAGWPGQGRRQAALGRSAIRCGPRGTALVGRTTGVA